MERSAAELAAFAADLRALRRTAGSPTYRTLARRAGYSASTLSVAAGGRVAPTLAVTLAYVGACGGEQVAWEQRWHDLQAHLGADPGHDEDSEKEPARRAGTVPRQLPPDVYGFTGRARELASLDGLLGAGHERSALPISVVSGTAGVGKTALAVHWATRVRDAFPDGHLYVDLCGYGPEPPLRPDEVLAGFLRSLGFSDRETPHDVAERAALYRTLVAGLRLLVVLDNASSVEQVRPLLPGSPTCFVMVTSRDSLPGLVVRHGARRIDLDLLPMEDAVRLLGGLLGERVAEQREAATILVDRCARLPLALRIAAELAAARPTTSFADLAAALADERRRMDAFDLDDDPRTAVRAVFSWSYRHLPADAARMFRLIGVQPGHDLDLHAAAALAGVQHDEAVRPLDVLMRAHLVQDAGHGRFGMHDLLRAYAMELAMGDDAAPRRAALTRLLDHYLDTATHAADALSPTEGGADRRATWDGGRARGWLDANRTNLVAAVRYAAENGWPGHAGRLAAALWRYLDTGAHHADARAVHGHALRAARATADRAAEADALHNLGTVTWRLGRYDEALEHYQAALTIRDEIGDRNGEGRTRNNLGIVYHKLGRYRDALAHYERALDLARQTDDRAREGKALNNLGVLSSELGRYGEALEYYQRALAITRETGDQASVGRALNNLGTVYRPMGRYDEALDHHQQALAIARETGDRAGAARVLNSLANLYLAWGYDHEAHGYLEQALTIHRELGDRDGESHALDDLGLVYQRLRCYEQARDSHRQALAIGREAGDRQRMASALNGLGEALHALGRAAEAVEEHRTALRLAEELGNQELRTRALDGMARAPAEEGREQKATDLVP